MAFEFCFAVTRFQRGIDPSIGAVPIRGDDPEDDDDDFLEEDFDDPDDDEEEIDDTDNKPDQPEDDDVDLSLLSIDGANST